jgi:hypothetical protein
MQKYAQQWSNQSTARSGVLETPSCVIIFLQKRQNWSTISRLQITKRFPSTQFHFHKLGNVHGESTHFYLENYTTYGKSATGLKMCFIFPYILYAFRSAKYLVSYVRVKLENSAQTPVKVFRQSVRYCTPILTKIDTDLQDVGKSPNTKFHDNPLSGSRAVSYVHTDGGRYFNRLSARMRTCMNQQSWQHSS